MTMKRFVQIAQIAAFTCVLAGLGSSQAHAIEVTCENEFGRCTLTSEEDGFDSLSCSCIDESGDVGGGGDFFGDLTEEELMAECERELGLCEGATGESDTATTGEPGCGSDSHGGATTGAGGGTEGYGSDSTGDAGGEGDAEDGGGEDGAASTGGFDPGTLNCSVGPGSASGGIVLALLGLLGLRRRRR